MPPAAPRPHPVWRSLLGAGLALAAFAACRTDRTGAELDVRPGPEVSAATVTPSGVRLVNSGREPLAFTIFERGFSERVRFAPCVDPGPACVRLPAGQTIVVPFEQVGGYFPGAREALVYTWRVVSDGAGGHRADDMQSRMLTL